MQFLRAFAWLLVIGLVAVSVVPASERPVTGVQHDYEHFIAFGFVGFIFALAYSQRPAALELMQIPLPTRQSRLGDFFTDALAAWIGIGFAHLSVKTFRRCRTVSELHHSQHASYFLGAEKQRLERS